MMANRRWISVSMAFLILFTLTGCGKIEKEGKDSEINADGKIEIEFWYGLGGTLGEVMEDIIESFNASQDEIKVVGVQQSEYEETKKMIQAAVASKEVPATALLGFSDLRQFANRGIMEPLDDYIAVDKDFQPEDFAESFMSYCIVNEKTYGLPAYGTTQVMYYRKDLFEKAGIDPDEAFKSWQSLAEAAEKLTVRENGETVVYGWEPMYGEENLMDIAYSNGGSILNEDGTKVILNSREWVEAWEAIRKWIHEDKIMRIHFGGDGWEYWYKTIDDVMQGRAAGYVGSSGDLADLDFTKIDSHIQPGFGENPPKPYVDAITCGILADASGKQKEAGFKWLSYLTSAEGNSRIAMAAGYVPVRNSVMENPEFKSYIEEHPWAEVPIEQSKIGRMNFIDPTGGKIFQAITDAGDLVEIENVSAKEALDKAQKTAQQALDEYLDSK
ncbi:ABC transporter substrate-binding protein [Blautia sp.]|uniref:ABC transporter substrate-binding protein n=1 Tax=Blautia sp. TaxID=1955243 RepID=UPI00258CDC73|nr:ABC transporter substrate-binding protein [Blautia sp.]